MRQALEKIELGDAKKGEATSEPANHPPVPDAAGEAPPAARRALAPDAQRALAEAGARRAEPSPAAPSEVNGRGGLDPVRYGDWEVKGLAADF